MSRQRGRRPDPGDVAAIVHAVRQLRHVRDMLHGAGAHHAADKARSALKSADGALRHARGRISRLAAGARR